MLKQYDDEVAKKKDLSGINADCNWKVPFRSDEIRALNKSIDSFSFSIKLWIGGLMITLFVLGVEYKTNTNLFMQIIANLSEANTPASKDLKPHATP